MNDDENKTVVVDINGEVRKIDDRVDTELTKLMANDDGKVFEPEVEFQPC